MSAPGPEEIAARLLDPVAAAAIRVRGKVDAAVLVPLLPAGDDWVVVLTERRADLRRHAGEISFPGGRREPGEELRLTALREAHEEVGLHPDGVRLLGALPPITTLVTGYRVYPFVGQVTAPGAWVPQEREVARILEFPLERLRGARRWETLWRKRVPVPTVTFTVDGHLIWGATARMLDQLLRRLPS